MASEMSMPTWVLRSGRIHEVVSAPDQFSAFDVLRDRPVQDFGLIVTAEPDEDADPVGVRTSALLLHWGREADAAMVIQAAIGQGLPDTSVQDRELVSGWRGAGG